MTSKAVRLALVCALLVWGCDSSPGTDGGGGDVDAATPEDAGIYDDGGGGGPTGAVDFVPIYEAGSAWESDDAARAMVDSVFADFEATLRTSGDWDATVEVFLTDDNPGNANVTFDQTFQTVTFEGREVRVVPTWQLLVLGGPDPNGPAGADGTGAEFFVHFNVADHADNPGLLRHEMMHGLGAVATVDWFIMTAANELTGPTAGERQRASIYDLQIVDANGAPLVDDYDTDGTFAIQAVSIEPTLMEWMDGDGGLFFVGREANGDARQMSLTTGPRPDGSGELRLNEVSEVMAAGVHPTWDTIEAPDRAFFRALGYRLAP